MFNAPFSIPKIRRRPSRAVAFSGGFSLMETLIAVAVVSILAALIVPSIDRARKVTQAAQCQSNLRQIGAAMALYSAENMSSLPKVYDASSNAYWFHQLLGVSTDSKSNYLGSAKVLACPSNKATTPTYNTVPPTPVGYGMFDPLLWYPTSHRAQDEPRLLLKIASLSDWPVVMDGDKLAIYNLENPTAQSAGDSRYAARHNEKANVLMADGHVEQVAYGDRRWRQQILNDEFHFKR